MLSKLKAFFAAKRTCLPKTTCKFTVIFLFVSLSFLAKSQPVGANMSNPVVIGTFSTGTYSFSDTKNNSTVNGYLNDIGQPSDDIYYKFTVLGTTQLMASHCGSGFDTYMWLLNSSGGVVASNDDFGPACSGTTASIGMSLAAGTYYIVSEGYYTNTGNITTSVTLTVSPPPTPPDTHNFIKTWNPTAPESDPNVLITKSLEDVKQTSQYFDGLGRADQTVIKEGSVSDAGNFDLVTPIQYDANGRQAYKYLPYASTSSDGIYKDNALSEQHSFYTGANSPVKDQGESDFYSKTDFEPSPLNRVAKTYPPGVDWVGAGKGTENDYLVNTDVDAVRKWTVTNSASMGTFGSYASPGSYSQGSLYKYITTDENGKQVIEFKDKAGNLILKKVQLTASPDNGSGSGYPGWLCTYYIYDDLNNLRCVVQPHGVELISPSWSLADPTILSEQCFRYEYDQRNRMIMKQVPGGGTVNMVYDALDRLVMTQDANLLAQGKYLVTKYDELDRPVETGLWNNTTSAQTHRDNAMASNPPLPYPTTLGTYELLTLTHYNDYSNIPGGLTSTFDNSWSSNYVSDHYAEQPVASSKTQGMVTWTQTKVLGTTATYLYTVNIYDDKGRMIQVKSTNLTQGTGEYDCLTTQYSWSGQPLIRIEKQLKSGTPSQTTVVVTYYTYDDLGRPTQIEKKLSNSLVNSNAMSAYNTISTMDYDALGNLKYKTIGSKKDPSTHTYYTTRQPLQELDYDYNIRGWLLGMNRDYLATEGQTSDGKLFGFELGYDKLSNKSGQNFTANQLNGNISGMVWKSDGDDIRRKYDFTYNATNRLLRADFVQQNADNHLWNNSEINYNVKMGDGINATSAYDANGNIQQMQQWGLETSSSGQIDNLMYTYFTNSNKLKAVTDPTNGSTDYKLGDFTDKNGGSTDYGYDINGNLVTDLNKRLGSTTGSLVTSGGGISYNFLNLPVSITAKKDDNSNKGTITYTYDAGGNKLKKQTVDYSTSGKTITTTTTYINGFVYESKSTSPANTPDDDYTDKLQFVPHEEGRIRTLYTNTASPNSPTGFEYDYMIKDHLGNARMVITEESHPASIYQATMEDNNRVFEDQLFNNIDETVTPNNKPSAAPDIFDQDANNKNVSELYNVSGGDKRIGPGIVLKVMAGDHFNAKVYGWYADGTNTSVYTGAQDIVTTLISAMSGGLLRAGSKGTSTELSDPLGPLNSPLKSFLDPNDPYRPYSSSRPKAYLNWMVLDAEQFKLVEGSYGAQQIPAISSGMQKQLMQSNNGTDITITKNGYLYVYVSNESQGTVYFDDLRIEHTKGPIMEETHYYPFGLTMAGISDKAAGGLENKIKFQGQELQHNEFSDGSGLEMYGFKYRMDDPQIGRFWSIDPLADKYVYNSTYAFSEDKVTTHVELEGLEAEYIFAKAKQELADNFQSLANSIDNAWSYVTGNSTSTEVSSTPLSTTSVGTTTTNTTSSNFGGNMNYIIAHNSNAGNPEPMTKTVTKTTIDQTTEIKTPAGIITNKTSVDKNGIVTQTTGGKGNITVRGVPVTVSGSVGKSSDGNTTITVQGAAGATTTKGVAKVQYSSDGKTQSVTVGGGVQQKVGKTTTTSTYGIKFGW